MTVGTPEPRVAGDWRKLYALGLPAGSVRAVLAILVFATIWGLLLTIPTREIPGYLGDLLFIIMGHYFAVRHRAAREPDPGPAPLYLPRGSVRLVLIAGSLGVAVLLYRRGQLTAPEQNPAVVTLLLVGGFLLGVAVTAVSRALLGEERRVPRFIEDMRALLSLAAAVLLVVLVWNRAVPFFPTEPIDHLVAPWVPLGRSGPEHLLAAIVGFYFGSRS
jgi:hypothetical protein